MLSSNLQKVLYCSLNLHQQTNHFGAIELSNQVFLFMDALKLYAGKARNIVSMESIHDTDESVFFILRNGISILHPMMNQFSEIETGTAELTITAIHNWTIGLLAGTLSLVVLLLFLIIKPIIWTIAENRESVLCLFTDIPLRYLLDFKKSCETRLRRMDIEREKELNSGYMEDTNANEIVIDDVNVKLFLDSVSPRGNTKVRVRHNSIVGEPSRIPASMANAKLISFSKFVSVLFVIAAYFICSYYIEFGNIQDNLTALPATVLKSSLFDYICRLMHVKKEMYKL